MVIEAVGRVDIVVIVVVELVVIEELTEWESLGVKRMVSVILVKLDVFAATAIELDTVELQWDEE